MTAVARVYGLVYDLFMDRLDGRGPVKGPWVVRVAMEALRRHERTIALDERARIEEGRLVVASTGGLAGAQDEVAR